MRKPNYIMVAIATALFGTLGIDPVSAQTNSSQAASSAKATADRDLRSRISAEILRGDCVKAKSVAIEASEFDLAEQVLRLCVPKILEQKAASPMGKAPEVDISVANALFRDKKYAESYEIYKNLYEMGNTEAANQIGFMIQSGLGVPVNKSKAIPYFQFAADRGDIIGSYNIGFVNYTGSGTEKDYKKAFDNFKIAADREHAESQNYIGLMYANGFGVERDYQKALEWYKRAAKNGSRFAQQNISALIAIGAASPSDITIPVSGSYGPEWRRKPTSDQMASFYPKSAALQKIKGKVVLRCEINTVGETENCKVISEDPSGYGFADAALKLAKISEFIPRIIDGMPVKSEVTIPLNFNLPDSVFARLIKSLNSTK